MIRVEAVNGEILAEVAPNLNGMMQTIPGAKWKRSTRTWTLPLTWASCVMLRGTFGERLEIGPALMEWAAAERTSRIDPAMRLRSLSA